jgi:hypothetical protein
VSARLQSDHNQFIFSILQRFPLPGRGMSQIFFDATLFAYVFGDHAEFTPSVQRVLERSSAGTRSPEATLRGAPNLWAVSVAGEFLCAGWRDVACCGHDLGHPRRCGWRVRVVCGLEKQVRTAPIYEAVKGKRVLAVVRRPVPGLAAWPDRAPCDFAQILPLAGRPKLVLSSSGDARVQSRAMALTAEALLGSCLCRCR